MFEWDPVKAGANQEKHGVSFEEASTVLGDTAALDGTDLGHSTTEPRRLRVGTSATGLVLVVAYTVRRQDDGESIRIISARRASRRERVAYSKA